MGHKKNIQKNGTAGKAAYPCPPPPFSREGCLLLICSLLLLVVTPLHVAFGTEADDTFLVTPLFDIEGSPGRPFEQPTDVAVGKGEKIYVLDGVNSRVAVFSPGGKHLFDFGARGSGNGQLLMPVGIDASASGLVVVADSGNARIQVFSSDGVFRNAFSLSGGSEADPTDVVLSRTGNEMYICDNDNHRVEACSLDGKPIWSFGSRGTEPGQFRFPATIDLDAAGNLYVVDALNARVQVLGGIDSANALSVQILVGWGKGEGRVLRPKGVVVDGAGRVFVSDSHKGIVQVFSSGGNYLGQVTGREGEPFAFVSPTNIYLDGRGRLYVVETRANRVRVLQR